MNPFEQQPHQHGDYTRLVRESLSLLSVGETMEADTFSASLFKYRATVQHISKQTGMKFATKSNKQDQTLWIKRVA